jgi:hypothetical protein
MKLQSETAKINTNLSYEQKNKSEARCQQALKDAKEAERAYMQNINIANNLMDIYVDTMKKVLNQFQSLEEKLIDNIKDALRKYVIYQVALVRNMQYDIEKKANVNFYNIYNGEH